MSDLFAGLNESQSEAVSSTEGYYRIIAGAGSGKTRTLTHRFAYLVRELGVPPQNILCVTFTNKAAAEMRSRIKKILGGEIDAALITTYHGFCVKVLKEDINRLFFPSNFKILDVAHQKKILEEIYAGYDIKLDYKTFEETLNYIYTEKTHLNYIKMMIDPAYSFASNDALGLEEKIYIKYLEHQKKIYGLDFNDLLYFTIYLFENNEDILNKWRTRLHYIQVDEFQDSSKKELDIINMLCTGNNNLFVVGDPDQNIYEWRSSDTRFLVHFEKNYPNVKTIFLTQNYRSTPEILNMSNNLISKNINRVPKDLFTQNASGALPEHAHFKDDEQESKWLADKIKSLAGNNNYADIAVLFRSSFLSRAIEQTLYQADIPYIIHGGVKFFDRAEIKDCIAFLKLINDTDDDASFLRIINVPKRQIGKTRIDFLKYGQEKISNDTGEKRSLFSILSETYDSDYFTGTLAEDFVNIINYFRKQAAESGMKVSEILNGVLEQTGYKAYISRSGDMERFDNVTELLASISEFEMHAGEDVSLAAYIQQLVVISDYESERTKNCVKLMTIHSAKGLEFPVVIIAGMTEGIFPSRRTLEERKLDGLEEERRLCYVAVTRAMRELYLLESENGAMKQLPSRFLYEVEESCLNRINSVPEELIKSLNVKVKQISGDNNIQVKQEADKSDRFKIGDILRHKAFGTGELVSEDSSRYYIKFAEGANPKPIVKNYAGLVRDGEDFPEPPPVPEPVGRDAPGTPEIITPEPEKKININFSDWNKRIEKDTARETNKENNFNRRLDKIFASKRVQREPENFELSDDLPEDVPVEDKLIENEIVEHEEMNEFTRSFFEEPPLPEPPEIIVGDDVPQDLHDDDEDNNIVGDDVPPEIIDEPETDIGIPVSLYNAPPQILFDNEERINLWNDPDVPKKGWVCADVIDLGAPFGECGMCGKEDIRYVHIMRHDRHQSIGVGCVCAGKMEGDLDASKERENALKNKIGRFATFAKLDLKISKKGNPYTKYKDTVITFMEKENIKEVDGNKVTEISWSFVENGEFSNNYKNLEDAKRAAFEKVDARRK